MTLMLLNVAAMGVAIGCGSHAGGSAGSSASSTASSIAAPSASASPSGRLTYEQLDEVYQQELFDMKKMKDPYEKKISAVTARLGKPSSSDATAAIWYGLRPKDESLPESCYELRIEKSGASAIQTVDDAKCR